MTIEVFRGALFSLGTGILVDLRCGRAFWRCDGVRLGREFAVASFGVAAEFGLAGEFAVAREIAVAGDFAVAGEIAVAGVFAVQLGGRSWARSRS